MKFKSEILGQFLDEGGLVFENFAQCIGQPSKAAPVFCGIDFAVGHADGDQTVVTMMDAERGVVSIATYQANPNEQIEAIAEVINSTPTLQRCYLERNGIGDIYYDLIKKSVKRKEVLHSFTTSNESKRAIIEQLNSAFNTRRITIPQDRELIKQLSHFACHKTATGKITYEGLQAHDDYVMSLAICLEAASTRKTNYNISIR